MMLEFDIKVATKRSALYCIKFERHPNNEMSHAAFDVKKVRFCDELESETVSKVFPYKKLHHLLGHIGKNITIEIGKHLKYDVTERNNMPCEHCTIAKAQRKNLPKISNHVKSNKINERLYLDGSSIKRLSINDKAKVIMNSKRF